MDQPEPALLLKISEQTRTPSASWVIALNVSALALN